MFDNLTERLSNSFKALQGKSKLSESNIKDAIREVRRSLLEADVALEVINIKSIRGVPSHLCRLERTKLEQNSILNVLKKDLDRSLHSLV